MGKSEQLGENVPNATNLQESADSNLNERVFWKAKELGSNLLRFREQFSTLVFEEDNEILREIDGLCDPLIEKINELGKKIEARRKKA
ncbi:MAG TPA: hypothetical protein VJI33_00145 [Candidatus Paceibacterota bacterium]